MKEITVAVQNRIAKQTNNVVYVCGNSDYAIKFTFDEEWSGLETKTARFVWNGQYEEVIFTGDTCPVPVISNTYSFGVGVYAGNLRTTTPAYIPAKKSILCGDNAPSEGGGVLVPSDLLDKKADKKYVDAELLALLNYVNSITPGENGNVTVADGRVIYFGTTLPEDAPAGSILIDLSGQFGEGVSKEQLEAIVAEALKDGVAAIVEEAVQDAVKDITPEQIGALPNTPVIPVVPNALPNPFALNFTGAVEGSYDGRAPLEVNIPQGGGSDKWEFIGEFNVGKADVAEWIVDKDADEKPISLKQMYFEIDFKASAATTANTKVWLGNPASAQPFRTNCAYAAKDWITTSGKKISPGEGLQLMCVLCGDEDFYTVCLQQTSQYTATWNIGRSSIGGSVLRRCIGGIAFQSAKAETGLIGANSTVKIWGVRM